MHDSNLLNDLKKTLLKGRNAAWGALRSLCGIPRYMGAQFENHARHCLQGLFPSALPRCIGAKAERGPSSSV